MFFPFIMGSPTVRTGIVITFLTASRVGKVAGENKDKIVPRFSEDERKL
jgi:hypothetical protein